MGNGNNCWDIQGQNMHKRIFNLVQALPRTSLLWGMLQSPPKHPNAQPAYPEPWQELPALGHLMNLKDRTCGLCDAQEPLAGVQTRAVPAQRGAEAQNWEMCACMQHSTGNQDGSTSPFWKGRFVGIFSRLFAQNVP